MIFIRNNITDPYFNIAAEEYFLKKNDNEYFLLYVNDPSVIIGKHQNAYAEINYHFIRDNNIKIVRRISGGGSVWHDPGNLNFAFIKNGKQGALVNFRRYMQPVIDYLNKLGLKAGFQGKNSIEINSFKVSGNAEHIYKNRILHHGTLLFNSNLNNLEEALKADPEKYLDKSVKSLWAKTANIIDLLGSRMSIRKFADAFISHIMESDPDGKISEMKSSDIHNIQILAENKYSTWEWNFGYSPIYLFEKITRLAGSDLRISFKAEKAQITNIRISGSLLETSLCEKIESALTGRKHEEKTIEGVLQQFELNSISDEISPAILAQLFF
jgi:lipoate-protein ligase A